MFLPNAEFSLLKLRSKLSELKYKDDDQDTLVDLLESLVQCVKDVKHDLKHTKLENENSLRGQVNVFIYRAKDLKMMAESNSFDFHYLKSETYEIVDDFYEFCNDNSIFNANVSR